MKTKTTHQPAPAEWIESLEISKAQLEAGLFVDSEVVFAEMDEAIARIEARRKNATKSEVA